MSEILFLKEGYIMIEDGLGLRQQITELKQEIKDHKLEIERLQLGGGIYYYHDLHCNADRRKPMGCSCCSCFMYKKFVNANETIEAIKKILNGEDNK